MYGDVNVRIEDRRSGGSISGVGRQVKIGIADGGKETAILITGSMEAQKIKEKLGNTPLAGACMDSVENGANEIYCIPVSGETKGTAGEIKHTGDGTGTLKVQGNPLGAYEVSVRITKAGKRNEGDFQYEIDGQACGKDIAIPINGMYALAGTGLTLQFGESEEDIFANGDVYEFWTSAPVMSNQEVLEAISKIGETNLMFECIHIVGASGKSLWAALTEVADAFLLQKKRPCFFICEARKKDNAESMEEYVEAMKKEAEGIDSIFLQVVCSHSRYVQMDGMEREVNNAGIITGLYCRAKESQSIGEVKRFPISNKKMQRLLPEGIEGHLKELDAARYLTVRQYSGLEDFYVTSANMFAPQGSNYRYAEDVRVANRLVKEVRIKALQELQTEIDLSDAKVSLISVQENINVPVEKAIREGIISDGRVEIEDVESVNLFETETVDIAVRYIPKGHLREINLKFSVENPYA